MVMVDIVDSEECFNKDIAPYRIRQGEFDVQKPYFYAKNQPTDQQRPSKKRKKSVKEVSPSEADMKTKERHHVLRAQIIACLEQLPQVLPKKLLKHENTSSITRENDEDSTSETIDFPSIQKMVEVSQNKFTTVVQEDDDSNEGKQFMPALFEFTSSVTTELDIFSIFNTVCINRAVEGVRLLQLTPTAMYLIPPKTAFLMGSLANSMKQLDAYITSVGRADLIVMDPPWPNKSVQRSSHYETQDIYDLFKIAIPSMIGEKDSIVAVWVTNKPKFRNFIIHKLFPSWKLECVGEWIWLKVTNQAECVFPLDSEHKKPYEQLIIGRPYQHKESKERVSIPQTNVIVSVPSVRHSRKPPLGDVLSPYLSKDTTKNPVYVELFARCLMPGWISWGNECLKFQHVSYYEKESQGVRE
ncbi:MT-A70-domain-containing protein [Mycotypha africana]|uniref:MT-A70-domain-containing protein n=1 Tax=Mycotypha africana TaxID=64632 RepID=UPI00230021F6|nr:MT-A70-domain-containing protein [Mycotypha africana]KAI8972023.1 MT-A70-domain-containing protein [Mycotypha africana]